ncbi:hypothetical protein U9M48_025918 [Paspalum notatum var. saurae]|uniref:RNA polymerase Rpb4/RPC9 core domain-containing protein n=1 Tax=Paspalum notatum var. saurae TaxID=547442 RepID=A0AAQ3WYU8_PASNO
MEEFFWVRAGPVAHRLVLTSVSSSLSHASPNRLRRPPRFGVAREQSSRMSGEEEENAAELKIGEEFLKAKCLMNCEVAIILEHKYEQIQQHASSDSDPSSQVSQVFEKSLQYVKRFSRYKNPDAVRQVRETLSRYGLAEFELCTLGNLCPDTSGEATALVPSLKSAGRFVGDAGNDKIDKMLNDLSLIKKFE